MRKILMLSFVVSSMLLCAKGGKINPLPPRVTPCQISCTEVNEERKENCKAMYGPNGYYPNPQRYDRCLDISEHFFKCAWTIVSRTNK